MVWKLLQEVCRANQKLGLIKYIHFLCLAVFFGLTLKVELRNGHQSLKRNYNILAEIPDVAQRKKSKAVRGVMIASAIAGIIKCISLATLHCCTQWWPAVGPYGSGGGLGNMVFFCLWSGLTLYHYFSAMLEGPGYLPKGWQPPSEDHKRFLQFCKVCQGYKAPRVHHCRKCERCVMKMDHHCPWINNCLGHRNHTHFVIFLLCAVIGSLQASVILSCTMLRALNWSWYYHYGSPFEPVVYMSPFTFIGCVFSLGLAIGVVVTLGMLFVVQMKGIMRNRTMLEDWIVEKARQRRLAYIGEEELPPFVYPYDLGRKKNLLQVFNFSYQPLGDGIEWPVVDGCGWLTLTAEQLAQKELKRQRTRRHLCVEDYSGRWLPISKGLKVCCRPPCSDEPRLPLVKNEQVDVTRWKAHWLYGDKVGSGGRGWFPRRCTVEVIQGGTKEERKKDQ